MRYELTDAGIDGVRGVYAVHVLDRPRPGVLGWIQRVPGGWRRYGYDDDAPLLRTPDEAVDDLIERDSEEQDTADWPTSMRRDRYGRG